MYFRQASSHSCSEAQQSDPSLPTSKSRRSSRAGVRKYLFSRHVPDSSPVPGGRRAYAWRFSASGVRTPPGISRFARSNAAS